MKERFLMIAVSILLVYCAGTLAVAFNHLTDVGSSWIEANRAIAFSETVMASLFTLVGLAGFVVALWNTLKHRGG